MYDLPPERPFMPEGEKQNQAGNYYHAAVTPGPLAPKLLADFSSIEDAVRIGKWHGTFSNENRKFEEEAVLLTEHSFFNIFDFPLIVGNKYTALSTKDQIVITESIARKYFGNDWRANTAILSQVFVYENRPFKLAAIVEDPPKQSSIQFDILLPLDYLFSTDKWSNQWNSNNYHTYIKLKTGVEVGSFQNILRNQLRNYTGDTSDILFLQPLRKQYLYSRFDFNTDWGKRSNIIYVKIFSGIGLLLLLLSCVNFINLSTARSIKRSLEVGVRKINGASRSHLIKQFLSESIVVSSLSGCVSVLIIKIV